MNTSGGFTMATQEEKLLPLTQSSFADELAEKIKNLLRPLEQLYNCAQYPKNFSWVTRQKLYIGYNNNRIIQLYLAAQDTLKNIEDIKKGNLIGRDAINCLSWKLERSIQLNPSIWGHTKEERDLKFFLAEYQGKFDIHCPEKALANLKKQIIDEHEHNRQQVNNNHINHQDEIIQELAEKINKLKEEIEILKFQQRESQPTSLTGHSSFNTQRQQTNGSNIPEANHFQVFQL